MIAKRAIPFSLAPRLCCICSNPDNYKLRTNALIDYLANRGYDKTFLKTQIQLASDILRTDALTNKPKTQTETTPFVITYNPALPNLAHIIHKHSNVLYSSDRCRNAFKNLPLVAYRRCKNISDILVRAQLTNSTDTSNSRPTPGSFWCNNRNCTTFPYIERGRNQYTFHSTGETHHIKSHITFNVIYLIQCGLCNLQYTGETKRRLKDRFNEHRRPILNPTGNYIHTAVSEHFLTGNYSDNHMLLIPIEKLKNGRDSFGKAREAHVIHKAKTMEPLDINKRDQL